MEEAWPDQTLCASGRNTRMGGNPMRAQYRCGNVVCVRACAFADLPFPARDSSPDTLSRTHVGHGSTSGHQTAASSERARASGCSPWRNCSASRELSECVSTLTATREWCHLARYTCHPPRTWFAAMASTKPCKTGRQAPCAALCQGHLCLNTPYSLPL